MSSLKKIRSKYIFSSFNLSVLLMLMIFAVLNIIQINDNIRIDGVIRPRTVTYIKSPSNSYLKELYVVVGEEVKKGQLLARLDDMSIRIHFQNLKSELIETENRRNQLINEISVIPRQINNYEQEILHCKVRLNYAQALYESYQNLYQQKFISEFELKVAQNDYESLKIDLARCENNLTIYQLQTKDIVTKGKEEIQALDARINRIRQQLTELNELFVDSGHELGSPIIIAPSSGVISAIGSDDTDTEGGSTTKAARIHIGRNFEINETIFEISDPTDIYIDSVISENDFPFVFEGDRVTITFPAYPTADYGSLRGIVEKLYKEPIDEGGNTVYRCEIKIVNMDTNFDIKAYLGLTTRNTIDVRRNYNLYQYMLQRIFHER